MGQPQRSEADLRELLDSEKDAHNTLTTWTRAYLPDGTLLSASLMFSVECHGENLFVRAEWKGAKDQQIFIKQSVKSSGNLARICMTRCHGGIAHWHFLEGFNGIPDTTVSIANPPDVDESAMDELLMHFVESQKITNFNHPGVLL